MRAILQNFKNGEMTIEDVPPPSLKPEGVIVKNICSLVSSGTEKAAIEFAKMNPLQKSIARPDLFNKVMNKVKQDGLISTGKIVKNLISAPIPLGYSSAGIVIEVGSNVGDILPDQRVACAGLGYANHAEIIYVPRNLLTPIPQEVDFMQASFVTVGSIAMQGVRQANLSIGETVVVMGMGLVGQIISQICLASGCKVIVADIDKSKVELGLKLGADNGITIIGKNLKSEIMNFTSGNFADAVIIAASTKSSDPLKYSPAILRDRGRVVTVGDVGHNINRRPFYEKEIEIKQSRSYGPGRYDPNYEEKGNDYPIGYIRWTENRNMQSFLDLIKSKKINLKDLVTHEYNIEKGLDAFQKLTSNKENKLLGIVINYKNDENTYNSSVVVKNKKSNTYVNSDLILGVIGAGQFAQGILLPILNKNNINIKSISTNSGFTSLNVAKKYNTINCTSNYREILNDKEINTVLIATRHNTHSEILINSMKKNKNCFMEKPLALNEKELNDIIKVHNKYNSIVMVGFNRRFSPLSIRLKDEFNKTKLMLNYRINAGYINPDEWQQDKELGGGRIVGEVCHFIDLLSFICNSKVISVKANAINSNSLNTDPDNILISLTFANGSLGSIIYTSFGDPGFSKERIEVFGNGKVGIIENWKTLKIQGNGKKITHRSFFRSLKGFDEEIIAFIDGCKNGYEPIPFDSIINTTKSTFAIQKALRIGKSVNLEF